MKDNQIKLTQAEKNLLLAIEQSVKILSEDAKQVEVVRASLTSSLNSLFDASSKLGGKQKNFADSVNTVIKAQNVNAAAAKVTVNKSVLLTQFGLENTGMTQKRQSEEKSASVKSACDAILAQIATKAVIVTEKAKETYAQSREGKLAGILMAAQAGLVAGANASLENAATKEQAEKVKKEEEAKKRNQLLLVIGVPTLAVAAGAGAAVGLYYGTGLGVGPAVGIGAAVAASIVIVTFVTALALSAKAVGNTQSLA